MGPAVGGVGGIESDRTVVVAEADEAGILHTGRFSVHGWEQHTFGNCCLAVEFDAIHPFGDGPDLSDGLLRPPTSAQVGLQRGELAEKIRAGEALTERIQDIRCSLA